MRNQYRADAEQDSRQSRVTARKAVGIGSGIEFDRTGTVQDQLEQRHEHRRSGHGDNKADTAPPRLSGKEIGRDDDGYRRDDDAVSEHGEKDHDLVTGG